MFENLKDKEKEGANKEEKLDEKVDDIFAETEGKTDDKNVSTKKSAPEFKKPETPQTPAGNLDDFEEEKSKSGGVLKKIFVVIIILAIIGIAAYLIYSFVLVPQAEEVEKGTEEEVVLDEEDLDFISNSTETPAEEEPVEEEEVVEEEPVEEEEVVEEEPVEEEEVVEEDPVEEEEVVEEELDPDIEILKTIDSDGDGLSDYDEGYVIGTDPFNPDTDEDGYEDLAEITNCYNPLSKEGNIDMSSFIDPDLFVERFPEIVEDCELSLD